MDFPQKTYTDEEVRKARFLISSGYRHRLTIEGDPDFGLKAKESIRLIQLVGLDDFFRTYIRKIKEIDGISQLRSADATIWANKFTVDNPVDAASFFMQKASQMKKYLEGEQYYSGEAEKCLNEKRREFLVLLKNKSDEELIIRECERLLKMWSESSLVY